jgi:hypothetical protein
MGFRGIPGMVAIGAADMAKGGYSNGFEVLQSAIGE